MATPEYLAAFLEKLKPTLPAPWWQRVHAEARAVAGGRRSSPKVWAPAVLERAGLSAVSPVFLQDASEHDLGVLHNRLHAISRPADPDLFGEIARAHARLVLELTRRRVPHQPRRSLDFAAVSPWSLEDLASAETVKALDNNDLAAAHRLLGMEWRVGHQKSRLPSEAPGVLLSWPHAAWVVSGHKQAVVRGAPWDGGGGIHFVLGPTKEAGKARVWGWARFGKARPVSAKELREAAGRHRTTPAEVAKLYPGKTRLWLADVTEATPLASEAVVRVQEGRFLVPRVRLTEPEAAAPFGGAAAEGLLRAYDAVAREMRRRRMPLPEQDEMADQVRKTASLAFAALPGEIMVVPDFACLVGSAVTAPEEAHDVDVLFRAARSDGQFHVLAEGVEVAIRKALDPGKGKDLHYIASAQGPNGTHLPLYHLMLVRSSKRAPVQVEKAAQDEGLAGEAADRFWALNWRVLVRRGEGRFVLQAHWRGLSEEEAELDHAALLRTDHSLHNDLRFEGPKDLWGVTVFAGTAAANRAHKGGTRLSDLPPDDSLEGALKAEQPKTWLEVGRRAPLVSKPGEVGATSQAFAKFFALDYGTYAVTFAREHAIEIILRGEKGVVSGRFQIVYAPVGDRRAWLISRPADQKGIYADAHAQEEVLSDLRSKGQRWMFWRDSLKAPLREIAVQEKMSKPFASPGGKDPWLDTLRRRIPPHRTYVEPYIGGGSLFWDKEPSEREIISDIDPPIIAIYRFLQTGSDADFAWLRERPWTFDATRFRAFAKDNGTSLRERAYRAKYLNWHGRRGSFRVTSPASAYSGGRSPAEGGSGKQDRFLGSLEGYRKRLEGVKVLEEDALAVMRRYDAPDTFFYLDPPWKVLSESSASWKDFDGETFRKAVLGLKGKVLISYQGAFRLGPGWRGSSLVREGVGYAHPSRQRFFWNYEKAAGDGSLAVFVPIAKLDDEKRLVYGIVLEPGVEDTQGDIATLEAIEEACHNFLARYRVVGEQHHKIARPTEIVECYTAPHALTLGQQGVRKGAWIMAVRIMSDSLWRDVKAGRYTGFSIGGFGESQPISRAEADALVSMVPA